MCCLQLLLKPLHYIWGMSRGRELFGMVVGLWSSAAALQSRQPRCPQPTAHLGACHRRRPGHRGCRRCPGRHRLPGAACRPAGHPPCTLQGRGMGEEELVESGSKCSRRQQLKAGRHAVVPTGAATAPRLALAQQQGMQRALRIPHPGAQLCSPPTAIGRHSGASTRQLWR